MASAPTAEKILKAIFQGFRNHPVPDEDSLFVVESVRRLIIHASAFGEFRQTLIDKFYIHKGVFDPR